MGVVAQFNNIKTGTPILGFTGAIGSGCTFIAKALEDHFTYRRYALADAIDEALAKEGIESASVQQKQDKGDQLRRAEGPSVLALRAMEKANTDWGREPSKWKGILLDGIRNTGEIAALRQLPNCFLISVQASEDIRYQRLHAINKCKDREDFDEIDRRDREGHAENGQQVTKCNYASDIVVINEQQISKNARHKRRAFLENKVYSPYLCHIEDLANPRSIAERYPTPDEALMTLAYAESRRSSCLKRKVGAVIVSADGLVLSSGHNEVPPGAQPCINDPEYQWCARDVIIEQLGKKFKHCPACGEKIDPSGTCIECGTPVADFTRRCRTCNSDPGLSPKCKRCSTDIFSEFLAGKSQGTGKMLDVCRALHAEENAILGLAKAGGAVHHGAVLYTTTYPCNLCANKIAQAGIREVVFSEPYVTKEATKILRDKNILVRRFEGIKNNAYFRLF